MNELDKLLVEVDKIEDDEEWIEAEHDTVQQYCEDKNYKMTEDEMKTIRSRGLEESFEDWVEFKKWKEKEDSMDYILEYCRQNLKRFRNMKDTEIYNWMCDNFA